METSFEGIREVLASEGETALEEVQRRVDDGIDVETETVEGTPSNEIVRCARDKDVDVIVMGTHGRGGLNRLLLGSVAERVVRKADVPVTTIRVGEPSVEEFEDTTEVEQDATTGVEGS